MIQTFTVSEINQYVKSIFSMDENLRQISIKGELSNFVNHQKTGHFYFTLKDSASSLRAVMFRTHASKVRFRPENGMNVLIRGSIQVFERDGVYQLYCESMEPDGIGALYLAFEHLKKRLAAEGLFAAEHKKPLPAMPKRIGVVTAKTGAAIQDIVNILSRRYPLGSLVLVPALVQGENAPQSLIEGIRLAQAQGDIDVLIVGRGGGSIEDLWAFNDEGLARTIYDCAIPVISAVGHEVDFTISDFVADLRAPTPSAAAELCAPSVQSIYERLANQYTLLQGYTLTSLKQSYEKVKVIYSKLKAYSPETEIRRLEQELFNKQNRLELSVKRRLSEKNDHLLKAAASMEALSPMRVLTRGYTITYYDDKILTSCKAAKQGKQIKTLLPDGEIISEITSIRENE